MAWTFALVAQERARAVSERDRAEDLAAFITDDLYARLEPLGRVELLDDVIRRVADHYEHRNLNDPLVARRYAQAGLRRGQVRRARGDLEAASDAFQGVRRLVQKLLLRRPTDIALRQILARTAFELAWVHRDHNRMGAALAEAEKALEQRRALDGEGQAAPRALAESLWQSGTLLQAQGRPQTAQPRYEEALALLAPLAEDPEDSGARLDVAALYGGLGAVAASRGQAQVAFRHFEKQLDIARTVSKEHPSRARPRVLLADAASHAAQVLQGQGESTRALVLHRQALEVRERLTRMDPGNTARWSDLTTSLGQVASLLLAGDDFEGARPIIARHLQVARRFAERDARHAEWQASLARAMNNHGEVLRAAGQLNESLAELRRALTIRQKLAFAEPGNKGWRVALAASQARLARVFEDRGSIVDCRSARGEIPI